MLLFESPYLLICAASWLLLILGTLALNLTLGPERRKKPLRVLRLVCLFGIGGLAKALGFHMDFSQGTAMYQYLMYTLIALWCLYLADPFLLFRRYPDDPARAKAAVRYAAALAAGSIVLAVFGLAYEWMLCSAL
ncbi:MAG: hypothetical protein PUC36_02530 [Clostridiales bacterium]|nr:hypothetical protein [Clostridiales bacterium]